MELFSELYGVYYKIVADILAKRSMSRPEIQRMVNESGFAESVLQLIPKLLDERAWPLMEERDGIWHSKLLHTPRVPVTLLEKRWLKAVLADPRARLFLLDEEIARLNLILVDEEPLFNWSWFRYFDRYRDGDNYQCEEYIQRFRRIRMALCDRTPVDIRFYARPRSREKRVCHGTYLPLKLEYSAKDDKFRVQCIKIRYGKSINCVTINLGRVIEVRDSQESYYGSYDPDICFEQIRCEEPVVVEINPERNAVERFLVEFSAYEKQSRFDEVTGICTASIWYPKADETEIIIKILGFGPVVRVLSPDRFLHQIRFRVQEQSRLTGFV